MKAMNKFMKSPLWDLCGGACIGGRSIVSCSQQAEASVGVFSFTVFKGHEKLQGFLLAMESLKSANNN